MERDVRLKEEALRYLGYRGQEIDSITDKTIDETIEEIKLLIEERYIYKEFEIEDKKGGTHLKVTDFYLKGRDIKRHLKNSKTCVLMAATLGHRVDTKIRYYEKVDMTKALILDAVATSFIEELCDRISREIESELLEKDMTLTYRYSPGYGDLNIEIQNEFLNLLDSQKAIGLTSSSNSILIPRKSVTAIVGIIKKDILVEEKSCMACDKFGQCNFSRGGNGCGY